MPKRVNAFGLRLSLIILLYLVLAVGYSIVVPIGRGADEWAHYWYAQFIAQNRRLPLTPEERDLAGYKSDWPPLYHLATAAVTGWVNTAGPPTFKYRADNIRRQLAPAQGPEAILHTEDELFPWRQEILVWHLGRLLSIAFSTLTLVVTYLIALEVFGADRGAGLQVAGGRVASRRVAGGRLPSASRFTFHASHTTHHASHLPTPHTLALAATAVLAFTPRFLFTGMLFNYDSLTLLLASSFLWLAIRVAKGHHGRWGFWALGALAGLALLTKYLTLLLPLVIVWVAVLRSRQFWLRLAQAALAYLLVVSWWFGYLLVNFNEIDAYGPLLGALAPLIRGDSSDRTVEQIFAWLSGGQAPPPAYIEQQSYTAWQIISEFCTTLWGNVIVRPYPLNWFVLVMTIIVGVGGVGIIRLWRLAKPARPWLGLLLLYCALPLPFMLIRLFGARDALESVQGRHLLFLAGPAVAILIVAGLAAVSSYWPGRSNQLSGHKLTSGQPGTQHVSRITFYALPFAPYASHFVFQALLALLLTGALGQLIWMKTAYPPLLPVRTTADPGSHLSPPIDLNLPGGAHWSGYDLVELPATLQVNLYWQGGDRPAPEDYQIELALVDTAGQIQANWRAYQTQARYPTRAWEAGDLIRDVGWLPLAGLEPGDYELRMRILGQAGVLVDWFPLTIYTRTRPVDTLTGNSWQLWVDGQSNRSRPLLWERATAQFSHSSPLSSNAEPQLIGPDALPRQPVTAGAGWANFIVGPEWPAGDYFLAGERDGSPVLRVAANQRNFTLPQPAQPLTANFAGKIKLLGYDLPGRRVEPGSGLPLTLYWQGLGWLGEDFVIFTRLLDNEQLAQGGYDRRAQENYSTLLWAPGEVVVDGFAVPVKSGAPSGVYWLDVGWYHQVDGQAVSLPLVDPVSAAPLAATAVRLGPIKVGGAPPGVTVAEATPQTRLDVHLGDQIKLLGFDLNSTLNTQQLKLVLYWQALTEPATDYTVFVHLRDSAGEIVAQQDGPPAKGAYPTSLWDAGEVIKDEVSVPLAEVRPGQYEVVVGMYDLASGERLPVADSPDGTILLRSIVVQ